MGLSILHALSISFAVALEAQDYQLGSLDEIGGRPRWRLCMGRELEWNLASTGSNVI